MTQLILDAKVVLLLIVSLIGLFGWWLQVIGTQTLIYYMKKKGYVLPDKRELRKYTRYAARKMLGLPVDEID